MKKAVMDVDVKDEYLHDPPDRRLWNESYYFDFRSEPINGFLRLGFQPFERRANYWFYVAYRGRQYFSRTERIPLENCHGTHFHGSQLQLSARPIQPKHEWSIDAGGTCNVADSPEGVFVGTNETVPVEARLRFNDPVHEPVQMNMFTETQNHYNQFGQVHGEVSLAGESVEVDGMGFRDHSWGWFRDWTPGEWGHYGIFIPFDQDHSLFMVTVLAPDGSMPRTPHGYLYQDGSLRVIEGGDVECDDGFEYKQRAEKWARGQLPRRFVFQPEFEDGSEQIECEPLVNMPIGYEDRNWALRDRESHWLKSVINRMLLRCEWDGRTATGWMESTMPL